MEQESSYLIPIIQYRLERDFANSAIFRNPRISEINDITKELAKRTGNVVFYKEDPYIYEMKLRKMIEYHVSNPTYLEVEKYGEIKVNIPEYMDFENKINRKEYLIYQNEGFGKISRARFRFEQERSDTKSLNENSLFNEDGIEIKREVTIVKNNEEERKRYIRMDGKPHIIEEKDLTTGEIKYFDIRETQNFENLDLKKAKEVNLEETELLTPVERIRLAERTRYSVYGDGIKKILGMDVNRNQRDSNEQR